MILLIKLQELLELYKEITDFIKYLNAEKEGK